MKKLKKLTIGKRKRIKKLIPSAVLMAKEVLGEDPKPYEFNRAYTAAMNQLVEGSGLRQLTDADYDEIEHFYGVSKRSMI